MKKKISFIIPCYNEEQNVKLFYQAAVKSFKDSKYLLELIFINDGSNDNTLKELKELLNESEILFKIINFSRNFGKEAGIYAGLTKANGDYIVIIDADMQQPPELVLQMLKVIESHEDIDIVTYYQSKRIENKFVSMLKKGFYKVINALSDISFYSSASDFRLFNRNVLNSILSISEHNRFSKGIFSWIGFNTYYLPYVPQKRAAGNTSWSCINLIKYAFSGILSFSKSILRIPFKTGLLTFILAIVFLIIYFTTNIKIDLNFAFTIILLMFSITFFLIGIIGEYIYRSYDEARNRPIYIIKEYLSNEKVN